MATLALAAVGAAVGGAIGGSVLGISAAVIGQAVGATIGRVVDQQVLGGGSQTVETGRVDRFRLTGASEGRAIPQIYGRVRISGQVIWATRFEEHVTKRKSGGKGGGPKVTTKDYSYSVSVAVALCEGEIARVGRVWADGTEVAMSGLNMRVYRGTEDQLPDAKIEAVEGTGQAPAYRGIAYVVFEDLDITQFGNRFPQFSFEVLRPAREEDPGGESDPAQAVRAVALIPGTGEYALATEEVHYPHGLGEARSANVNTPQDRPDFLVSMDALREELPACGSVSLIVSWFGDDLRMGHCGLRPRAEHTLAEGKPQVWRVDGETRGSIGTVPLDGDARPVYGGTPSDASVIQAIQEIRAGGQEVMFYPFILMEQLAGNGLPDPWGQGDEQPVLPWRGRITLSKAPGQAGSPDGGAAAEAEVAAFFGAAQPGHFSTGADTVSYIGPAEYSYRRFILHYAHLCALAGGVDAFCIGSEMRSLTQVRGASGFPAVAELIQLAAEVRAIMGPETKISYAADWSEYFGYHPADGSGDVYFHLDPLWAAPEIDFIGIDNYMPLSDWREGQDHADAGWGSLYSLEYLRANVAGGEGYAWYYPTERARQDQARVPISDGAHGEDWIFRYKDLRGWWQNAHHERIGGVRQAAPTGWLPESKPIRFTEYGCAAIHFGTNQPNKFLDPKSSESALPHYSNGGRDDLIQMQYIRAMALHWGDEAANPVSSEYGAPMVDMSRAHLWAWDARPYPYFPNSPEAWSDGENYARGHWLNGRTAGRSLASVVEEICVRSGLEGCDTSGLYGYLRGYQVDQIGTGRAALQPLLLTYGVDGVERDGVLSFKMRTGDVDHVIEADAMALTEEQETALSLSRRADTELAGRVRFTFIEADRDYEVRSAETVMPGESAETVSESEAPIVFTRSEGRALTTRHLSEARVARDAARFALPPSALGVGAGDVVELPGAVGRYRVDQVLGSGAFALEATRVEPAIYRQRIEADAPGALAGFLPALPVFPLFLDLPLMTGEEVPHAPHLAVAAVPWPGSVAVFDAETDAGYQLNTLLELGSIMGVTETPLLAAAPGRRDRGAALRVRFYGGAVSSAAWAQVLSGANAVAIGDGTPKNWEILQFSDAQLVGEGLYELSGRLRGQLGSDALMPQEWPVGSYVVLLDGAATQISLASSARNRERHYRIGPATLAYDHPAYVHETAAFSGVGLRPFAPAHLRAKAQANGDLAIRWARRTRIDGDSWEVPEVPLGEESESYLLRVMDGGTVVREEPLASPAYLYTAAAQAADGPLSAPAVSVAQVSARFGAGLFTRIELDG
ncbi:glycoside hydrolase/phage tail family protein [Pseudoruegeria sp. SHC-113]|uniref:baseplate multidomain protein megatron n=1 Tax=Pseudoruegeria sp. SHC-113 TaxID=2855439 RepID=UPI0021BB202A|nr:glycoside hydrolase/phage tail family protein [Pseudoruegeria sp. SHC-113]MCT8160129.1 glycoside hydrolase/phage tail family protein [Pseudoruegeria sp. SHC-113]